MQAPDREVGISLQRRVLGGRWAMQRGPVEEVSPEPNHVSVPRKRRAVRAGAPQPAAICLLGGACILHSFHSDRMPKRMLSRCVIVAAAVWSAGALDLGDQQKNLMPSDEWVKFKPKARAPASGTAIDVGEPVYLNCYPVLLFGLNQFGAVRAVYGVSVPLQIRSWPIGWPRSTAPCFSNCA